MANGGLTAQPLSDTSTFNWVLLVELLVCGILTIFFLGYFDRLFATLVSYGIRAYTWRNFHAYIDIKALQLSLLGGRIFFKDIRYHAHNETILVHSGYITWNYWYHKVRDAEVFDEASKPRKLESPGTSSRSRDSSPDLQESGGIKKQKPPLPCRINVKLEGVQAFLYNRSPVYDAIVDHFERATGVDKEGYTQDAEGRTSGSDSLNGSSSLGKVDHRLDKGLSSDQTADSVGHDFQNKKSTSSKTDAPQSPTIPFFLKLFPIRVRCKTAAAVLGNENTRSIITAKLDNADGTFDAGHAGPLDAYKLLFGFEFENVVMKMKPNQDFKELQLTMAAGLKSGASEDHISKSRRGQRRFGAKGLTHNFWPFSLARRSSTESVRATSIGRESKISHLHIPNPVPGQERWQGLTRYLEEDVTDEHDEWDPVEYARLSTLAEVPKIGMKFYWDIPGLVPHSTDVFGSDHAHANDINGSAPPEYGMDLSVYGGTVNYGPWTDRQRVNFQSIFFPASYADAIPTSNLLPGDSRVSTVFKLYLSIEEEMTLRIPVREPSKDWKWKGKADNSTEKPQTSSGSRKGKAKGKRKPFWRSRDKGTAGPNVRPFAWLDVKIKADSTVNYTMDMVARNDGYHSNVKADIRGLEISTSVNHGLLWRSGSLRLDCDTSVPLGWNALRDWKFDIVNDDLELFILRDHLFLLTDVIADWTAGPPQEYFTFTPYRYNLDVTFQNFKLYLNTNSSNIINEPADFDQNQFVNLEGRNLHADVIIPLVSYRPVRNEVFFDVLGKDLSLQLLLSPGNTVAAFLGPKRIAELNEVTLEGSHAYYTDTSTEFTDRLTFNIHGSGLDLYLFGFVVDRLMTLKENYFGDDLHFRTLEEFQDLSRGKDLAAETDAKAQQFDRSNDLDVILIISADTIRGFLPANMYNADDSVVVDCPYASADLRLNNYYMDLQVDFSPLTVSHTVSGSNEDHPKITTSQTEIFVASASLGGHRTFGLPPSEPDYLCLWDVNVGSISGECSSDFVNLAGRALACFAFSLDDNENAMGLIQPFAIHDITFLRLRTEDLKIWLHIGSDALLVRSGPATVDLNDWAGLPFSQRIKVRVPDLTVALVDIQSGRRHRTIKGQEIPVKTHAYLQTTISLDVLVRKLNFTEERQKQQDHLVESDSRTHRTSFLIHARNREASMRFMQRNASDPPAMVYPAIPAPLVSDHIHDSETDSIPPSLARMFSRSPSIASPRSLAGFGQKLSRKSSRMSLASSIRRVSTARAPVQFSTNTEEANDSSYTNLGLARDQERTKRGLAPSSVAFTSPLAAPYFPLHAINPNDSDLPDHKAIPKRRHDPDLPVFNDVVDGKLHEDIVHTSIIITAEHGVRCFLKPEAVNSFANLLDLVIPKTPENLLDILQITVVSVLLGLENRKEGAGASIEIGLHVPFVGVRFLNAFEESDNGHHTGVDQYDLEVTQLAMSLRNTQQPIKKREERNDAILMHCTAGSVSLAVKEKADINEADALGFRAELDELLIWLTASKKNSIHVSFRRFDITAASNQVELLAAVIYRTILLANESVAKFTTLLIQYKQNLRYLAYSLTMAAGDVADPPFLNRTALALRIAPHHLRNHDSWKIISRLRYIWHNMSKEARHNLELSCRNGPSLFPTNAQDIVTNNWDAWRTWELAHVKKSYIMRELYGSSRLEADGCPTKEELSTEVQIRSGGIRVIIDPGYEQTQLAVDNLTVNFRLSPPLQPSGLMLVEAAGAHPIEDLVLQASAKSVILRVHWEILNLIEYAVKLASTGNLSLPSATTESSTINAKTNMVEKSVWRTFQVVLSIGNVATAVDTTNVNVVAASKHFRMSLSGTDKSSSNEGLDLTTLLHAAQSHIDLHSHQRHVAHLSAELPNVFASRNFKGRGSTIPEDLRIAATTSSIVVESREELLGVIEAVDTVIRDEVASAIKKFGPLVPQTPVVPKTGSDSGSASLPKITIALIMDAYRFDVSLLPSLKYSMSGKVGRVSVSPTFDGMISLDINFDLDEHAHDLISRDKDGSHVISVLKMPPINGNIKVKRTRNKVDVVVNTIIETIVFEAHAVHGLLSTISQKEVSNTFKAIKADIDILKRDIEDIIPQASDPSLPLTSPSKQTIAYSAAITLAGVEVRADAPGKLKDSGAAKLLVAFNCLSLNIFNITAGSDELLPVPEIHGQMRELLIDLLITDKKGTRRSGNISMAADVHCTLHSTRRGQPKRNYQARVTGITINVFAETASAVVDVLNHVQDRLKDVDFSREKKYLQRLRQPSRKPSLHLNESIYSDSSMMSSALLASMISVSLHDIQVAWIVGGSVPVFSDYQPEDLVLSIRLIDLSTKSENASTLKIQDLQIQMVPQKHDPKLRSLNSALMPQVVFNVGYASTDDERKMTFQATGQSVDVLLDSRFMLPANMLQRSIELAVDKFRDVSSSWQMTPTSTGAQRRKIFGDKRLSSLLVDADFAGAVVRLQGRGRGQRVPFASPKQTGEGESHGGRYGQFLGGENAAGAKLETPGFAIKVQYKDTGLDSSMNAEIKVSGSSNTLTPTVVPLILDISDSIKTIVAENEPAPDRPLLKPATASSSLLDEGLLNSDPTELLGGTSFNLGVRICRQEFNLSCQPIARVAASAHLDDIYITANTVKSSEHDHFIAVSAQFDNLQASIQHIYSRESTFNFAIQSITLSIMNSKHLSGTAGFSAVLKVFPMKTQINARQLQDFLLFREIWIPPEIRRSSRTSVAPTADSQDYFVARYQQVATTAAFPWTATVQFAEMRVDIDLGQTIGKASLFIDDLWASSRKDSNWEQNLCMGIGKVGIDCTGRTSGFVDLAGMKVRTMIAWPQHAEGHRQTPSIQASAGFERLRVKAAFDYQAFGIADITAFDFLMYNVRPDDPKEKDRLVAMLEGDKVHVFCTATTAAQSVALFQAFEKLIQDTESAYANSLKDIEKFLRRQSAVIPTRFGPSVTEPVPKKSQEEVINSPISLYTDVVVTLRSIQVGAFPSAFFDSQIFLIEASDVQARFAVMLGRENKIRTGLSMTLGQLQVALTTVAHPSGPKTLQEITVDDVVSTVLASRGGSILGVPKVIATMETWQTPGSYLIEYIFKSRFEGKVDVGWNVGRITFIRGMYNTHVRNLSSRLGKPIPESAVRITSKTASESEEPEKITAVVNVPQSKYEYRPREPPIIETPQLRDMGEATPPLEWIGLQRDRLPNVTHQIVIVALIGVAREVEDAYGRILGNS